MPAMPAASVRVDTLGLPVTAEAQRSAVTATTSTSTTRQSTTAPRWRPSRAGILNVYQYEDETLHFAGGRLLLRGVNGSGKSTAMNMLLPFLLEADTRKIDAAGEQRGVLRSWMLADTEETQRTGYLWIEFTRVDPDAPGGLRHHTVGCGIRANRSTDRVTPWWFSTPRRARIDFSLTAQRIPLAVEALRAELGADAVFTSAADYRAEILGGSSVAPTRPGTSRCCTKSATRGSGTGSTPICRNGCRRRCRRCPRTRSPTPPSHWRTWKATATTSLR